MMYMTGDSSLILPEAIFMMKYAGMAAQIPFAMLLAKMVNAMQTKAGTASVISS